MSISDAASGNLRIGVDVGGTFTDLVAVDATGRMSVHKVPTTPSDPVKGVLAAVEEAASSAGLSTSELLRRVSLFAHGSTIATNTVLEGKGARVGLLATEGFRDALEIRRGHRENPWDHRTPYAPVLVPRYLRRPVRGRLDRGGRETELLNAGDVSDAVSVLRAEGIDSVAVCLFNSYIDDRHEEVAAHLIASEAPGIWITRSAKVAAVIGEYERSSTAVLNAYIAPRTVAYLRRLEAHLNDLGLVSPLLLIQNNGGAVSVEEVAERPVALLLSGPAAGIGALRYYAKAVGSDDLVSMEIGGTSCDVILMTAGAVAFSDRLDIGGYVCISPSVEIHTVGAGGGTIAHVDGAGLLHVGPAGAGARPGPACYGHGGEEATITDAQVVLGRIRSGPMAGGSVHLDAGKARDVIERKIARPLGIDVEAAADGMIRLMDQKLLHAVQRLSSERGHDPRRFTLVAAGGAGPLHGAAVGRALGVKRVYMPRLAGTFCALGMLNSDVRRDYARVHFDDLDRADRATLDALSRELEDEARAALTREGFASSDTRTQRAMDLRYTGQQWDITVEVEHGLDAAAVRRCFEAEHDRLFGHVQPAGAIEITRLRATGVGKLPPLVHQRGEIARAAAEPAGTRPVWLGRDIGWQPTPVFEPRAMMPGRQVVGPAVIEEETTTVLVGAGDRLEVDSTGGYMVHIGSAIG
jgi:N-methylhydantoinase A